jgi:hypothetical protein
VNTSEFLSQYANTLKRSADHMAERVTDDPARQWYAYCEFVYGYVFFIDQYLGQALAAKDVPAEEVQNKILQVDHIVLTLLLAKRANVDPDSDVAQQMYRDHHKVLERRSEAWIEMPTFARDGAGPAGTLTWEIPKQAARSATGEESAGLLETSVEFMAIIMRIPEGMKILADLLVAQRQAGR